MHDANTDFKELAMAELQADGVATGAVIEGLDVIENRGAGVSPSLRSMGCPNRANHGALDTISARTSGAPDGF